MKRKILLLVLLLTGCVSKGPKPLSTPKIDLAVAPPNAPTSLTFSSPEASAIHIPLQLNLDSVRSEVLRRASSPLVTGSTNKLISMQLGKASAPAPVQVTISHQVWLRDLSLRMKGNQFVIDVHTEFAINSKINSLMGAVGLASCGINEPLPRIQFSVPGTVKWGAQGNLLLKKGAWSLKWQRPCNLTALNLGADAVLNVPAIREKIDRLVSDALDSAGNNLGLQPLLAPYWPELIAPREIQPGLWLALRPDKVGGADLVGNGETLSTGMTVHLRPSLVAGRKPSVQLLTVPSIDLLPRGEGFHLQLRADLSLAEAGKRLSQQLAGKPFDVNGRAVLIDKIDLYGNGEKAVLGLTLKQPIQATIYLLGKPVLDLERNQIMLTDLEYSSSTIAFLEKSAAWMLNSTLREKIQEKSRFKFDEDVDKTLQKVRNMKIDLGLGAAARLNVKRVQSQGVFFTKQTLNALLVVDGKFDVDVAGSNIATK